MSLFVAELGLSRNPDISKCFKMVSAQNGRACDASMHKTFCHPPVSLFLINLSKFPKFFDLLQKWRQKISLWENGTRKITAKSNKFCSLSPSFSINFNVDYRELQTFKSARDSLETISLIKSFLSPHFIFFNSSDYHLANTIITCIIKYDIIYNIIRNGALFTLITDLHQFIQETYGHEATIANNLENDKIKANIVVFRKWSNPRKINNTKQS